MKTPVRLLDGPLAGRLLEVEKDATNCILPMPSRASAPLKVRYVIYTCIGAHPNGVRVFSSRILRAIPRRLAKLW
jgi:hypothetical protein